MISFRLKQGIVEKIALVIVFSYLAITSSTVANSGDLWYDECFNLQIPVSLVQHGSYATAYAGGLHLFDPTVTSGPTLMLPIAAVFRITGIGWLQARCVMLAFLWGAFAVIYLFSKREAGWLAGLLAIVAPLSAVRADVYALGVRVYGEVPALFWLLLGCLLYRRPYLCGVLVGFSILTKNQFVLVILLLLFLLLLPGREAKKGRWHVLKLMAGLVFVITLWESVQLVSLGWEEYLSAKRQLWNLAVIYGLPSTNPHLLLNTIQLKVLSLARSFQVAPILILGILFIVLLYGLFYSWRRLRVTAICESPLGLASTEGEGWLIAFGFTWVYLLWWFISAQDWYRYFLPSHLLLYSVCAILMVRGWQQVEKLSRRSFSIAGRVLVGLVFVILIILPILQTNSPSKIRMLDVPAQTLHDQLVLADWVKNNVPEDTRIFYWMWWQAPEISFLTNRIFYDIAKTEIKTKNPADLILISPSQKYWAPASLLDEKKYLGDRVLESGGYEIYQAVAP